MTGKVSMDLPLSVPLPHNLAPVSNDGGKLVGESCGVVRVLRVMVSRREQGAAQDGARQGNVVSELNSARVQRWMSVWVRTVSPTCF